MSLIKIRPVMCAAQHLTLRNKPQLLEESRIQERGYVKIRWENQSIKWHVHSGLKDGKIDKPACVLERPAEKK